MLWTRVGYTGGTSDDPNYNQMGDHSEAIEIAFDPAKISYETLLLEFWGAHRPTAESWSRQYRSAVFVHDAAQREAAERIRRITARKLGTEVHTAIEDAGVFTQAEAYHQKYRLRRDRELFSALAEAYPDIDDLVRSTAAARLNAWSSGYGTASDRQRDVTRLGLSFDAQTRLLRP